MGLERIGVSDYLPINGDWQNYNLVRRVLAGFIPYVDSVPYLGLGIVALILPFVILNNTFTMSLFATNFIVIVCFILLTLTIFYLTTKNLRLAMVGSLVAPLVIALFRKLPFVCTFYDQLMHTDYSFRMGRGFLPVLLVIGLLFFLKYNKRDLLALFYNAKFVSVIAFICGLFVTWSNDYSFCSIVAAGIVLFVSLVYSKTSFKQLCLLCGLFVIFAIVGILVSITVITLGHPLSYINCLAGIISYHYWYYGAFKITSLIDVLLAQIPLILPVPLCYAVLVFKFCKRRVDSYDCLAFFLLTTPFGASLLYVLGTGTSELNFMLLYVSLSLLLGWCINIMLHFINKKIIFSKKIIAISKHSVTAVLLVCLIMNCCLVVRAVNANNQVTNVPYVSKLGGYTHFAAGLEAAKAYIGDEKIFSTYAGALEVITDQFQPSGTDYIIHILGDQQREQYLKLFIDGNYRYVQTINPDFNTWEKWINDANWFFYRELLRNYSPFLLTDYSVIWQKNIVALPNTKVSGCSISKISDSKSELQITLADKIDCIADLSVSYDTQLIFDGINFRMYVLAHDTVSVDKISPVGNCWILPCCRWGGGYSNYKIPVMIRDGIGKIDIMAKPANAKIAVKSIAVVGLLPTPNIYSAGSARVQNSVTNLTNANWTNGVAVFGNILMFPNNAKFAKLLQSNPKTVRAGDYIAEITAVEYRDSTILVTIADASDKTRFQYPLELTFD
jgi:hypothetical protein